MGKVREVKSEHSESSLKTQTDYSVSQHTDPEVFMQKMQAVTFKEEEPNTKQFFDGYQARLNQL